MGDDFLNRIIGKGGRLFSSFFSLLPEPDWVSDGVFDFRYYIDTGGP